MTINQNDKPEKKNKISHFLAAVLAIGLMLTATVFTMERPTENGIQESENLQTVGSTSVLSNLDQITITPERIFKWKIPQPTPTTTPKPTITSTPTPTQTPSPTPTVQPTPNNSINTFKFQIGVNYMSTYHEYSTKYATDAILNRDFSKFQKDGITVISLSLYWYRIEGHTQGSYNDAFLDNIKHVIRIANQYSIKVLVTFHTLWGDDSPWCTPDYVIDPVSGKNIGLAIVRSPEMRQAYINMVKHTTAYLAGTPGIWAWAVLNEPWYWGRTSSEHDFKTSNGQTQKENFIKLFQDLSKTVKAEDRRPVTIRFCNVKQYTAGDGNPNIKNIFTDDWKMDSRLFSAVDFVSFNVYPSSYPQLDASWLSMTKANIIDSSQNGKQVWITEFGYFATNDQTQQATAYQKMLDLFATLPIQGCLAWQWTDSTVQDANSQSFANICADSATGEGKLAYQVMIGKSTS
ncbi:MAG: cellulase family glycosylhydrolase [Candidatus Bathyarchaeia archaeon]|jgi:hypothetical protein